MLLSDYVKRDLERLEVPLITLDAWLGRAPGMRVRVETLG